MAEMFGELEQTSRERIQIELHSKDIIKGSPGHREKRRAG